VSTEITINGVVIEFPEQGTDPDWGTEVNTFAVEVANVLNDIISPDDFLLTAFTLTNNQSSAADINSLIFDSTSVRSAKITADVYITTSTQELHEKFEINVGFKNVAASWDISVQSEFDDSGITFSITSGGQVQYSSTLISGTGYSGLLQFRAITITQ
jgi:hypothetical protein